MTDLVRQAVEGFDWFVLIYFLLLNTGYLVLFLLATWAIRRARTHEPVAGHEDLFANPLTPGVSIVIPAHDEEPCIVESVRSILGLRYPTIEVIVVDDGSTDGTFEALRAAYRLIEVDRVIPEDVPTVGAVRSVHVAGGDEPLVVVRKDNAGRCSDPINVGINAARQPLVCIVDADSVLDEESLLRVAKPFVDDPAVVASGGVVRAVNGCRVERGRVVQVRMPRGWLPRIQAVEYLRSFLLGRTGWARTDSVLIIAGAFGLFRRDVLVELGGMDLDAIGQDAELVARIHHEYRRTGRDYRVVFVPEPVCWTEVPDTVRGLGRQRRRWSRGMAEVLWKHRAMIGNPRYGRIGMVVLPYYLVFELIGPVVEVTGFAAVALGLGFGIVDLHFAGLFAAASIGLGLVASLTAIAIEEMSFRRYTRWRDLGALLAGSAVEYAGYRQLNAWWRLQGLVDAVRRGDAAWGDMPRIGFAHEPAPAQPAVGDAG